MEAKYFYNRFMESGDLTSNGIYGKNEMQIREKDNKKQIYTFFKNGHIICESFQHHNIIDDINIEDLKGNRWEIYNRIQLIRCGYILSKEIHPVPLLKKISKFFNGIQEEDKHTVQINITNINLVLISQLKEINKMRIYEKKFIFPVNNEISRHEAIYIYILSDVKRPENFLGIRKTVANDLAAFITLLKKELEINCKYVNMPIKRPICY